MVTANPRKGIPLPGIDPSTDEPSPRSVHCGRPDALNFTTTTRGEGCGTKHAGRRPDRVLKRRTFSGVTCINGRV
jgi:hypothetical protein